MNRWLRVLAPLLVVAAGALAAWALYASRDEPEMRNADAPLPLVRVQRARLQSLRLNVTSQGTVGPRTESVLVPEVSGTVIEVAASFLPGGFFEEGDLLLRIDPHDYRQAAIQAQAAVARAELRLALEQAEADVVRREWADLGRGDASSLTLHEPQLAEARAALASARAAEEKARRDVERTELRAPYAGRVREKRVDRGQFVNRGTPLGTIYAVDYAEVRLPLPDSELAFLDLPLLYRGEKEQGEGPEVVLSSDFAGRVHRWSGRIVRTEGEIDPQSRMVHVVARVKDPYARGDLPGQPPLAAGMFVDAEILGREVEGVAVLPRSVLREGNQLLVIDDEDRLRFRTVSVLRVIREEIIVESGLADGERVCLTSLVAVTDGMRVRTIESPSERDPAKAS